jgi:hypothetical protein
MPGAPLERFGLTANPFRELGGGSSDDLAITHVHQALDGVIDGVRDEVLAKENSGVLALFGGPGTGKSQRLLLTAAEGRKQNAFTVYCDVLESVEANVHALAAEIQKASKARKVGGLLGAPAWLRAVTAYAGKPKAPEDPIQVGRSFGEALNAVSPSFLLLNDLHQLRHDPTGTPFLDFLGGLVEVVKPGVLVMFSAAPEFQSWLAQNRPTLLSRVNRSFALVPFTDGEAGLLLAKKMLSKRIIEDLPPMYPFEPEAVSVLNRAAEGNPRRLLSLADLALELALAGRAYRVDADIAEEAARQSSYRNAVLRAPPTEAGLRSDLPGGSVRSTAPG